MKKQVNINEAAKKAQESRSKKKSSASSGLGKYTNYIIYFTLGAIVFAALIAVMAPSGKKLNENVIIDQEIYLHNNSNYSF